MRDGDRVREEEGRTARWTDRKTEGKWKEIETEREKESYEGIGTLQQNTFKG